MRRSDVFCGVINQYKHLKMENTQKTVINKLTLNNAKVTLKFHKVKFLFFINMTWLEKSDFNTFDIYVFINIYTHSIFKLFFKTNLIYLKITGLIVCSHISLNNVHI